MTIKQRRNKICNSFIILVNKWILQDCPDTAIDHNKRRLSGDGTNESLQIRLMNIPLKLYAQTATSRTKARSE